ncbi:CLUMA_CG015266, isoform A [Clunio marinus]|uniref:CLUMA_CG015266, isoform A n=1 Tax=Clunio marinus TaxID=568069 RepID=A0A1J1IPV0_9DIPT|nr:CLUMA_CG015266, isoform A [Clunio marinus]
MTNENTKFINSLFLKNLLENQFGQKDVKIKTYTAEQPSENGNVYTRAAISRIFVKFSSATKSEEVLSFVMKIKPTKGELSDEFKVSGDFMKEVQVYRNVLPAISTTLKKIGEKIEFTPNVISTFNIPTDGIVFEEVTNRGYHIQFEKTGLNFEQSVLALQKLACFHAASAMLMENTSLDLDRFSKGTFHNDWKNKLEYFTEAYRLVIDNANGLGIDNTIQQKLKEFSTRSIPKVIEDYTSAIKGFKVLNHGDFYTRNIFFKYKGNELVDVLFVDFQNAVIGTPLIDLFYFLTSSVAVSVLATSRDELVYAYHEALSTLLESLGYQGYIPSLNDIQVEFLKRSSMEMYFGLTLAPYLRSFEPRIVTAVQPSLYKDEYLQQLKKNGKEVLIQNKDFIIGQLKRFDVIGTLDCASNDGRIGGIKSRFSGKV